VVFLYKLADELSDAELSDLGMQLAYNSGDSDGVKLSCLFSFLLFA
jgi:hypothetical protein